MLKKLLLLGLIGAGSLGLVACGDDEPDNLGEAIEDAGDELEDAADEAEDELEDPDEQR